MILHEKMSNVRFTTVPLKPLSDQVWIRYACSVNFLLRFFLRKGTFLVITEINIFQVGKKTKISSRCFIRLRFQCYNCKSGIVIFSWVAVSVQLGGGICHWFVLRQLDTLESVSTIGTLIAIRAFPGEVSALTST